MIIALELVESATRALNHLNILKLYVKSIDSILSIRRYYLMNDNDYGCAASIAIILLLCGLGLLIWIGIEITGFKL